jgi:hypothetical protein
VTFVDRVERDLLAEALRTTMSAASGQVLDAALAELGWPDLLAEEPDEAIPLVLAAGRRALGWWLASFQAVRHRLAETLVAIEGAEATLSGAASSGGDPAGPGAGRPARQRPGADPRGRGAGAEGRFGAAAGSAVTVGRRAGAAGTLPQSGRNPTTIMQ